MTDETANIESTEEVVQEFTEQAEQSSDDGISPEVLEALAGEEVEESTGEEEEEASKEEEPTPEETIRFSKQWTKLAKAQKELEEEKASMKDGKAIIQKIQEASKQYHDDPVAFIRSELAAFADSDDEAAIDGAFEELFSAMAAHMLGEDAPEGMKEQSEYQKLQRRISEFEQRQLTEKQQIEQQRRQALEEQQIAQFKINAKASLLEAKDSYPFLFAQTDNAPEELVYQLIEQDYKARQQAGEENPKILTLQDATDQIEDYLKNEAHKWAALIPSATRDTPKKPTGRKESNRPGSSRTLTNSGASSAPTRERNVNYIEDEDESVARSIAMLTET